MAHFTRSKRDQLEALYRADLPQTEIARILSCSQSTISRELKRGGERYAANSAQYRAEERKRTEAHWYDDPQVFKFVLELLRKRQSPEQIAGRMKRESPWHRQHCISAKSIYTYIWDNQEQGGCLYLHLRRKGKRTKWFGMKKSKRIIIPNRKDISQRPLIVEKKVRCGDWESDLVIGESAVATFVERFSKYLRAVVMPDRTADAFVVAAEQAFEVIPVPLRLTMTHDNGSEICKHEEITKELQIIIYCARPYRSCDRGLNENTNGLLRDFFPKGTDFRTISQEELDHVVDLINNRPRHSLNFRTPKEVLDAEIKRYAFETSE